ncbi:radical SAM/SPASM domain-containing protein [Cyanobium sp. WAJ14-Wanaka]|uniref:radical SAM/SPASM domain-containing protein n=1 Tax=Cyanobium sp. WAJ14-Wanaka TaxID=2823725 RepID=UPI0020CE6AFC|nr:radical SAM/SPASM domain-containing protein [Cyanobium sp. WAJ14-Wanaka]MCP9775682.1 radical SAM protein [Cyanobium sp. WAJ14-Wanaka]
MTEPTFKPRIDLKNRTKLETVLPLSTPFVIFIDPSDACNFKCSFCPTGDSELMKEVGRPLKQLDWELYVKIIDDLHCFDEKVKVIRLYKDGEPLLNKKLANMVKYAKNSGYCDRVDTTTNASLLTADVGIELAEAGLDRINISIEGMNEEQYMKFSGYRLTKFQDIVDNVSSFYKYKENCEVIVKINGDGLNDYQKKEFIDTFGPIADGIWIESVMSCWPEFELRNGVTTNQDRGIYGQAIKEVSTCPYPFYSFSINPEGTVSLCFLDWGRKLLIGDVRKQSVKEIWNSDQMKQYRLMFLRGERKAHPVCGGCGQMTHGMPDDIDSYTSDLLLKYENN